MTALGSTLPRGRCGTCGRVLAVVGGRMRAHRGPRGDCAGSYEPPSELVGSEWVRVVPPGCDLCGKPARWRHPEGGLRCEKCPRPEGVP